MLTFENPFLLLLAIPLFLAAVLIWRNGYANLGQTRARVALGIRLALLAAIVLGLAGMGLRLPQGRQAVVFLADLSASDSRARTTMQTLINNAVTARPSDATTGVVSVGRHALVEQPPGPLNSFDGFATNVEPDYTNLEDGLQLSNAVLPDGYRHRVVAITDGQQNVGDALAAARLLHSLGVRIDVAPVGVPGGPEVMVDGVDVPSQLRPQERFSIGVTIRSTVATGADLNVFRDHRLVLSTHESIGSGANRYLFGQSPLKPGFHTFEVHITPARDTRFENNRGSAFTTVQGPPRVLVISASRAAAANVMASLKTTGIHADLQTPAEVVPTLGYLQKYASVVVVNTAADVLGPDLISDLVPYVRDLGHGLVVIGGQESYGMGGYGQTALEQALPVKMDLPKRKDLPSASVALIIENLEAQTEVNISKQAGKGVINLLTQQDQVAVLDALGDGSFAVRLQHVTDKGAINRAIDGMEPGDPGSYATDLQSAYEALRKTNARIKHIILLGDGDAEDPAYEDVVKKIRAGGITVSTVATNGLGFNDFTTMQSIAKWGGGRYYRADNTASVPNIFLREARTVARSGIITGKFYPEEVSANPMLGDVHAVPPLYGYVATTPKPTGEMILVSKKLDPVLAGWQFGLGRSVAWTSDAAGLWTRDWLQAPGANRFWADLVSWTLPAAQGGKLYINTSTSGGEGQISVDTPPSLGANPNVTASVLGPDLKSTTIQLQPSAPGHFHGAFVAGAEGAYYITADAKGASHSEAGQAGLAVPFSAEYRTTGTNWPFLRALATAGGGSIISGPRAPWQDNLSPVYAQTPLAIWLWLLALLLLPIDIGARRLVVTGRDLAAIGAAVTGLWRGSRKGETAVPVLDTVRMLRTDRRAVTPGARTSKPASVAPKPASGGVRILTPVNGKRASSRVQDAATNDTPSPIKPESASPDAPAESTAGRLLASKRRRK